MQLRGRLPLFEHHLLEVRDSAIIVESLFCGSFSVRYTTKGQDPIRHAFISVLNYRYK